MNTYTLHSRILQIALAFSTMLTLAFLPLASNAQVVTQTESFESTIFPAPGWRQLKTGSNLNAAFSRQAVATAANPTIASAPGGGANVMMLNSFSSGSTFAPDTTFMVSKPFDLSNNADDSTFSFFMYREAGLPTNNDHIRVYINTTPTLPANLNAPLANTTGSLLIPRLSTTFPAVTAGWHQYFFNLPPATYNQNRYYIIIMGVAQDGNNIYLDNFQINTYPSATNAADVSFNIFTQNGASVAANTVDHMIIGVQCIVGGTSGCGVVNGALSTAVKLDSLLFNTNGTTNVNDIQNAKVWYTGGSSLFSTGYISPFPVTVGTDDYPSSRFGQTIAVPATNLDFINGATSCFYLEYDTTYFWLTYDIRPSAVGGNFVDADFRGAAVGGTAGTCPSPGGTGVPVVPGPNGFSLLGSSQIDLPYCVPTYSIGTSFANYTNNDFVQSVILNGALGTIINTNNQGGMPYPSNNNAGLPTNLPCYPSCDFTAHPPDYELWRPVLARTVVLNQGGNYTVTVQAGTWASNNNIAVWIDFNRDGDFLDVGEYLGGANLLANASAPVAFAVPAAGYVGPTRMRVREVFATNFASINPCASTYTYGEVEDFPIIIAPNCPSAAYKLWLGNSDDWNNPANWCGGVPTITDSAVVSRALVPGLVTNPRPYFKPTIKSGVLANANSLFISDQDTLIVNAPVPSVMPLKVRTNLINNGRVEVVGGFNAALPFSTGTLNNNIYTPFKAASSDARSQIIYSAAEMTAAGMTGGDRITGLQFTVTSKGSTAAFQGFTVSFALVPFTQHASNVPFAGPFTPIFGPVPFTTLLGLNTINLATPITWDGTSNLLIQYCFDNAGTIGPQDDRISITQTTGIGSTLVLSTTTNAASGCNLAPGAGVSDNLFNALKTYRPNFTFILDRRYGKAEMTVQRNWINNGNFVAGANSRVIMDSTQAQIIGGTSPTTFHELRLNKGAANQTVTMLQPTTVADTLLLDAGSLLLNGNSLTINNPGASNGTLAAPTGPITRTAGFIFSESSNLLPNISYVRWNVGTAPGWRVIPFGDTLTASPVYIPFTLRHVSGDLGTFSVATYRTPANNLPYPPTVGHVNLFSGGNNSANVVNRFWMTDKTSPGNPVTDLTFRWSDPENSVGQSGFNLPRAQPYKFIAGTPNYEAWVRISNFTGIPVGSLLGTAISYNQTTNIINLAADSTRVQSWNWPAVVHPTDPAAAGPIGNYVPWALANNNTPLPVELLDFKAQLIDRRRVRLSWSTASEYNNDYFTVERSDKTMEEFSFIERVSSYLSNSNMLQNYVAWDEAPLPGLQYYRLKQTDLDGQSTYSDLRSVYVGEEKSFDISWISGSSLGDAQLQVFFTYDTELPLSAIITDATGRVVYREDNIAASPGVNRISIAQHLPQGMYFLILQNQQGSVNRRFYY